MKAEAPQPVSALFCLTGGRSQSKAAPPGYAGRRAQLKPLGVTCKNPGAVLKSTPSCSNVSRVSRAFGLGLVLERRSNPLSRADET